MDEVLAGLLYDRDRLLKKLAPIIGRVGPANPKREQINAARARDRKRIRKQLRNNADAIAARCMELRHAVIETSNARDYQ